jgi:inner membrane protein
MHVITHLLSGWLVAEGLRRDKTERAVCAWAAVAPDLDGLGMVVDWANRVAGRAQTSYYEAFHHMWGHGLPAAVVIAAVAGLATRRLAAAVLAFAMVHLHLLFDLLGSRGSVPKDIWPIYYLEPLSPAHTLQWSGQWPLTGWQNTAISALLLALVFVVAAARGRSPLELFNAEAERAFVRTVQKRWQAVRIR